jgi:hypothetical protein
LDYDSATLPKNTKQINKKMILFFNRLKNNSPKIIKSRKNRSREGKKKITFLTVIGLVVEFANERRENHQFRRNGTKSIYSSKFPGRIANSFCFVGWTGKLVKEELFQVFFNRNIEVIND